MNKLKKVVFILFLIAFSLPLFAQNSNFPQGSSSGRTEMADGDLRPTQIPNVAIQITEPRSGREVAFSVRLLLLLTILTLAPSILILTT